MPLFYTVVTDRDRSLILLTKFNRLCLETSSLKTIVKTGNQCSKNIYQKYLTLTSYKISYKHNF